MLTQIPPPPTQACLAQRRDDAWERATGEPFDVAILGAGVNGAAVFHRLRQAGYRVCLIDRGDFGSGTSQASGMLLWGGLLYLKSLDLRTVRQLCRARDRWVDEDPQRAKLACFRYLPLRSGGRRPWFVRSVLELYWWLGGRRRARPRRETRFASAALLAPDRFRDSLTYEEACLTRSDARLVLDWVLSARDAHGVALSHAEWIEARRDGDWCLTVQDQVTGHRGTVQARALINAGGVWADSMAQRLGIATRFRHVLSKGVYLGLQRPPELSEFLAFEMGQAGDSQTFTPWGPIALWGPTETAVDTLEGSFEPNVADLRFLLQQANQNLAYPIQPSDIVSLRTGVRPLAVKQSFTKKTYPLDLSRRHVVDVHPSHHALTIYGGKITSGPLLAQQVLDALQGWLQPRGVPKSETTEQPATPPTTDWEGWPAGPWIDPGFAQREEACLSLEDYLRRRTNLAQWTPRLGWGWEGEHRPLIEGIAQQLHRPEEAPRAVAEWEAQAQRFDRLIASV